MMLVDVTDSDAVRGAHDGRGFVLAMTHLGVVSAATFMVSPAIVDGLVQHAGFSEQWAGCVAAAELIGAVLFGVAVVMSMRRINWRHLAMAGVALAVFGNVLSLWSQGQIALLCARFLAGAGAGVLGPLAWGALALTRRPEFNFGVLVSACMLFGALGIYMLPNAFSRFGLGGYFDFLAVYTATALLAILRLPRGGASGTATTGAAVGMFAAPGAVLTLCAFGIYAVGIGAIWAYLSLIGAHSGLSEQAVANAVSLSQVVGIGGSLAASALATHLSRVTLLAASLVLGAASILLLQVPNVLVFTAGAVLFNTLWNFVLPFLTGLLGALDPQARLVALSQPLQSAGYGLGPLIAAVLVGWLGYVSLISFCSALLLSTLVLVIGPARAIAVERK